MLSSLLSRLSSGSTATGSSALTVTVCAPDVGFTAKVTCRLSPASSLLTACFPTHFPSMYRETKKLSAAAVPILETSAVYKKDSSLLISVPSSGYQAIFFTSISGKFTISEVMATVFSLLPISISTRLSKISFATTFTT